jgi:hypothetical protein
VSAGFTRLIRSLALMMLIKNLGRHTLHGGCRLSPPTWPLRACTASSPGPTKNRPLPWSAEEDARGRRAGTAPLRHRGTSLSSRAADSTEEDERGCVRGVSPLQNLPPRVAGHTCDRDEAEMEKRKVEAGEGDRRQKAGQSIY